MCTPEVCPEALTIGGRLVLFCEGGRLWARGPGGRLDMGSSTCHPSPAIITRLSVGASILCACVCMCTCACVYV